MYFLMHKNIPVLKLEIDKYGNIHKITEIIEESELPTGVKANIDSIQNWWKNNSIPTQRDSIRLGLECLGISGVEELKLLSHGLSLTNHYWIKEENEKIQWKDINFWDNGFSKEIGEALFNHEPVHNNICDIGSSPDAAENGMLKKRWINIDGKYYIQKYGSGLLGEEVFNEILASDILEAAQIPHSIYKLKFEKKGPTCLSECITNKDTELVHFTQIIDSVPRQAYPAETEYKHFCNILDFYNVKNYYNAIQGRLAIGYILAEEDMHYNNLALLKSKNGYSLSPFYDLGNCLYTKVPTKAIDINNDDIIARPFCNKNTYGYWNEQKQFIEEYPSLSSKNLKKCIINYINNVKTNSEYKDDRIELLAFAVYKRAYNLQRYLLQKGLGIPSNCIITLDDAKKFQNEIKETIKNFSYKKNDDKIINDESKGTENSEKEE